MADSSLDEFFAKKDKSKRGRSKSKAKYTTSDTITKNLEDGGKRTEPIFKKELKEKVPLSTNTSNQSISIPTMNDQYQEDDEWKNIEEKERDYSGLRVQALSISEKEKEEEQLKEQMLSEQNGESSKFSDAQGPWKVVQAQPTAVVEVEEEKPSSEPEVKVEEVVKTTGTYKPPALRNISSSTSSGSSRRYNKNAPQISSDFDFPTLSAAEGSKGKFSESDKSFQSVKHGIRSKGETQKELQLDLGNKFSALPQGE